MSVRSQPLNSGFKQKYLNGPDVKPWSGIEFVRNFEIGL